MTKKGIKGEVVLIGGSAHHASVSFLLNFPKEERYHQALLINLKPVKINSKHINGAVVQKKKKAMTFCVCLIKGQRGGEGEAAGWRQIYDVFYDCFGAVLLEER